MPFAYGRQSGGYKKPFSTYSKGAGAKEGLAMKMKYWGEKDFKYEYGVSIGAAANLAVVHLQSLGKLATMQDFEDQTYAFFDRMLDMKASQKFRDRFQEYHLQVESNNKTQAPTETAEVVIQQDKEQGNLLA